MWRRQPQNSRVHIPHHYLPFKHFLNSEHQRLCVCMGVHAHLCAYICLCHRIHVERNNLQESVFSFYIWVWGPNLGCQTWQQASLTSEPRHHLRTNAFHSLTLHFGKYHPKNRWSKLEGTGMLIILIESTTWSLEDWKRLSIRATVQRSVPHQSNAGEQMTWGWRSAVIHFLVAQTPEIIT